MFSMGIAATHVGRRQRNEDALVVDHHLQLYIVCDGMGGHARGDLASHTAAKTCASFVRQNKNLIRDVERGTLPLIAIRYLLEDAINDASKAVFLESRRDPELEGMGTTLTVALVVRRHLIWAHVGDSRLYLCREGTFEQLTRDHTVAGELVDSGLWSPAKARVSRLSHVLTRCVGHDLDSVASDSEIVELREGDLLLLCSDGLVEGIPCEPSDCEKLLAGPLELIPDDLIGLALHAGATDNITTIVVSIEADETIELSVAA